ncbi:MAG TPA: enoyl-CoA hydratase-related protein [Bryobacteraceae bacterium]|nr:enoyl-CoA hydratase-related protein [Bryobacteraceae bacterium]
MSQQPQTENAVLLEILDDHAVITLNRPRAYNAMNQDLADRLLHALIECDENPKVRAVLITANGPAFCAGGDIRQMQAHVDSDGHAGRFLKTLTIALHGAIATIAHMPKPVMTAVNGAAAGAGFSLAMAGDIVLAGSDAKFTVGYTAIGLSPDGSLTHHLPRLVGPKLAFELTCTNRTLSAEEARDLGIVAKIFPGAELQASARDYVAMLSRGPTQALGRAKRLFAGTFENSLEAQMEHERQVLAECGRTADFKEGIGAFLTKRPASFQGQ